MSVLVLHRECFFINDKHVRAHYIFEPPIGIGRPEARPRPTFC